VQIGGDLRGEFAVGKTCQVFEINLWKSEGRWGEGRQQQIPCGDDSKKG
jgi:hypothetical protein